MRKYFKTIMTAMLVLALSAVFFAPAVFAEEGTADDLTTLTLEGEITLTDHPASFSEEYTIVIEAEDETNPMPEGSDNGQCEFSVPAGEFDFPEIVFPRVGIYEYTVSQRAGTADRWTYDDSVYHVTVYVTNAEEGDGKEVTVAVYRNDEEEKSSIVFENVYDPIPASVTVTALKVLEDGDLVGGDFTFELKDESGAVVKTATNDANGNIRFEAVELAETGTYVYTLSEVIGTKENIIYDTSVYTITYTVTQDGDLVASASYEKNGAPYDQQELVFENIKEVKPGDNTNIVLWVSLFAVSAVAVVVLAVLGKKRK